MLTAKQEKFAQLVAAGSDLSTAYRKSYDCEKSSDQVIWNRASELNKHSEVSVRIAELQQQNEEQEIWTRRNLMERLLRIADEARQAATQPVLDDEGSVIGVRLDAAAARVELQAAEQAAKIIGVYEQKINARVSGQSLEDYLRSLPDD